MHWSKDKICNDEAEHSCAMGRGEIVNFYTFFLLIDEGHAMPLTAFFFKV